MSRVKGKSKDGREITINEFHTSRAAERFCDIWNWQYNDGTETYAMSIIDFA